MRWRRFSREGRSVPKGQKKTQTVYSFVGRFRFLSNFSDLHPLTAEHVFQAMKTANAMEQIWVLMAPTPAEAKKRGRRVTLREDWEEVKDGIMERLLLHKFQDPTYHHLLLKTGDAELIEGNTWGDTYWGVCEGKGTNKLGIFLMRIRQRLQRDAE